MDQEDIRFSPEHIWVRLEDDNQATIGVTEETIKEREEITKIRLASEGDEFIKDETFGRITTSKPTVIRLYAPVSGEVLEVNEDVLDAPETLLEDPYEEGWLLRVELSNSAEYDNLMTQDEYQDFLDENYDDEDEDDEDDDLDDRDDDDEDDDM
ncbi:MAG: glycine cleavage system protein H [Deltaproteobacteria bacterium]|nr:glycine cleavage system protein H [Deltaproteobacteria bacterium]